MPKRKQLTPLARAILRAHQPDVPAFVTSVLRGAKTPVQIVAIDNGYLELLRRRLVERAAERQQVLAGMQRSLFVLTTAGKTLRRTLGRSSK